MDDFTLSEINRVSLKEMVLQMINLNLAREFRGVVVWCIGGDVY